jgi:CRP-like cAMP-binding protein
MSLGAPLEGRPMIACRTCAHCPFCQLPETAWEGIEPLISVKEYAAGITLFRAGQKPQGVHLICQGQVKRWGSNEQGRQFLWRFATAGELLGVTTLLSGKRYPVTSKTATSCLIRFIPTELFFRLLKAHPVVDQQLMKQLATRVYDTQELLQGFTLCRSACERLAWVLYRLWSERHASITDDKPLRLYLSREEMAERIGVDAPETVSRLLTKLAEKGIIKRDRGATVILDPDRLKAMLPV